MSKVYYPFLVVAFIVAQNITRCKEVMNVDRGQFAQESVLVCPLPRCGHKWCKSCLKALASSQQHHRCKNSNIDRLMKRKGWKYCPGCRTPVQKETGCNHMTVSRHFFKAPFSCAYSFSEVRDAWLQRVSHVSSMIQVSE